MAFLTVAGIEVRAVEESATERPRIYQGGHERMYDNSVVSTEDPTTEKRLFDVSIDLYDAAEEAALRTAAPIGTPVSCGGDWLGTLLQALVYVGDAKPWQTEDGDGFLIYKTVTLHLEEA